ncbi:MAG: hypothetical protein LBV02_03155 [Bacteroidales bacterium]|jgi:hypothetical protein|nr:hypothetical protein [Bacteroidales bacterium]
MRDKLRRDNGWIGLAIGLLCPAVIFGVLYGIVTLVENLTGKTDIVSPQSLLLLSIIPNLFLLRHTLLKLKHDLTGRGIMGATFLLAIVFVVLEFAI